MEEFEKIVEKIVQKTGKSREEILKLVKAKKEKFSGLLTDNGAAFMLAKELNLKLEETEKLSDKMKISQLEDGMQNIELIARIKHIQQPKKFKTEKKSGKLCALTLADETGEIQFTLWHKDVDRLEEEKIGKNDVLFLHNAFVSSYNEKLQLNLSQKGFFEVNPKNIESGILPKTMTKEVQLADLRDGMLEADVIARIIRIYPIKDFEAKEKKGKVLNFEISDGTTSMRATAWNELAMQVNKLREGNLVKLEHASARKGLKGLELHLNWNSRIIKEPAINFFIPSLSELVSQKAEKAKIAELKEGDKLKAITAKISEVFPGKLHFFVCEKCGKKLNKLENELVCDKCGQAKEPEIRAVISFQLDDGLNSINAVAYGIDAEKILELEHSELKEKIAKEGFESAFEELRTKLIGKEITVEGNVKKNLISQETEFIVRNVKS